MLTDGILHRYAELPDWDEAPPEIARAMAQEILRLRALHREVADGLAELHKSLEKMKESSHA